MSEVVAVARLRAFIERVERIEADIAEMNAGKSDVYKEIRGEGFDVKTVRKIVSKRKLDTNERQEQDALFDLYWDALHGEGRAPAHARENIEEFGAELPAHDADGVIIEDQPETATKSEGVTHDLDNAYAGTASDENPAPNSHSTPSYPEVVEQAGAVSSSAAAPVPNSHSSEPASSQAETKTGAVNPPPAVPVTPFNNPRCQHPATCHFAGSRDACHDCLMDWAQRPKDEQIRLWAEANEAARVMA